MKRPLSAFAALSTLIVVASACTATPSGTPSAVGSAAPTTGIDAQAPISQPDAEKSIVPDATTPDAAPPTVMQWALVGPETASSLAGTSGGSLTTLRCPTGYAATGVEVDWVVTFEAIALHCRKVEGNGSFPGFGSETSTAVVKTHSSSTISGARDCPSGAVIRALGTYTNQYGQIRALAPLCEGEAIGQVILQSFGARIDASSTFTQLRASEVAVGVDVYVDPNDEALRIGGLRLRTQKIALVAVTE